MHVPASSRDQKGQLEIEAPRDLLLASRLGSSNGDSRIGSRAPERLSKTAGPLCTGGRVGTGGMLSAILIHHAVLFSSSGMRVSNYSYGVGMGKGTGT